MAILVHWVGFFWEPGSGVVDFFLIFEVNPDQSKASSMDLVVGIIQRDQYSIFRRFWNHLGYNRWINKWINRWINRKQAKDWVLLRIPP